VRDALTQRLHQALPQTQCQRCGYPDCLGYAQAMAAGEANINRCPPGGMEGVRRLAELTGQAPLALDPSCGAEQQREVAVIDEAWCIGCTLCIEACPVDAIAGANKRMHTVAEALCTGCALCLPPCPVDCIAMLPVTSNTGWSAWSNDQASQALQRYTTHQARLQRQPLETAKRHVSELQDKAQALPTDPALDHPEDARKRAIVAAALAKAQAKLQKPG
jgi:electron transport complex protein RnfB